MTETVTVIQWRPARSSSLGPAEPTGCLRAPSRPAAACVDSELRLQPGPAPGRALPAPRRPGDFIKIPAAAWASPASPARPTTRNRGRHVAIRLSGPERSYPSAAPAGPAAPGVVPHPICRDEKLNFSWVDPHDSLLQSIARVPKPTTFEIGDEIKQLARIGQGEISCSTGEKNGCHEIILLRAVSDEFLSDRAETFSRHFEERFDVRLL